MRLAGFLFGFAALPVFPQLLGHSGVRVGASEAYIAQSSDVREPASYIDPDSRRLAQVLFNRREQIQAQAKCSGATPLEMSPDGSAKELIANPGQTPCVAFETWAEERSSQYAESIQTGFTGIDRTAGKIVLRRYVRDGLRQIYVHYAATVETLSNGTYRVSVGSSSDPIPADLRARTDWMLLSPPAFLVPQIVRDEDSVRLLLYSDGRFRKLVDYIHVGWEDRMVLRTEAPRDYYADDAELSLTLPRVRVNGVASDSVGFFPETIRGPVLWIYVPALGRYVLSLQAHTNLGFVDAGEVSDSSLTFTSGGNVIRIDAAERVAAGSAMYSVQALADPDWAPADPRDREQVMIGAVPGLVGPAEAER